jgi:hypothetical protein
MKKLNPNYLFSALSAISLSSCYSTYPVYKSNIHEEIVGKNKVDVLRTYGVPNKTIDDGAGGTVLAYEKETTVTYSTGAVNSNSRYNSISGAVYSSSGILGYGNGASVNQSTFNGYNVTKTNKTFCHIFLDSNNVVREFNSNYGAIFDYEKCYSKNIAKQYAAWATGVTLFFGLPVAIVVYQVSLKNAKKKGIPICEDHIKRQ